MFDVWALLFVVTIGVSGLAALRIERWYRLRRSVACPACAGESATDDNSECALCDGEGMVPR